MAQTPAIHIDEIGRLRAVWVRFQPYELAGKLQKLPHRRPAGPLFPGPLGDEGPGALFDSLGITVDDSESIIGPAEVASAFQQARKAMSRFEAVRCFRLQFDELAIDLGRTIRFAVFQKFRQEDPGVMSLDLAVRPRDDLLERDHGQLAMPQLSKHQAHPQPGFVVVAIALRCRIE